MTAEKKKFLWIGWDGADWEHISPLIEQGLLPNLEKFINEGVMGNLATLYPALSPMLWNSAATGKYPYKHGIHGFTEPDFKNGGSRPYSSYSRKCKALWNIFSQQGLKSNVINWWASHPAEPINGCVVSNLFQGVKLDGGQFKGADGIIHPKEKTDAYIVNKVFANELTSEQLCALAPLADKINQEEDSRLETLAKTFAECLTTHSVATEVMINEPWDFMAAYYTAIDHFSHAFMQYHPPRMENVSEEDFEIFKDVVTGCYRFSDMMLKRMLDLCDDNTTVLLCSDHGFQSGSQRPLGMPREPAGPAIWHRKYGIFVMKGPNIKKDELIHGASLIDIAPTILATMGMPIGEDMDGRPLLEIFEEPPEIEYIPSWEDVPGESGMHEGEPDMAPEEAEELLKQFIALGYIDDPGDDKEKQQRGADNEAKYNLARSLIFASKPADAVPIFEELCFREPWETRYIIQWVLACEQAGFSKQAIKILESAFDVENTKNIHVKIAWCKAKLALNADKDELLAMMTSVEGDATQSNQLNQIGKIYIKLRKWHDAERAFNKACEMHPEDSDALSGLCAAYFHTHRYNQSIEAGLDSVSLVHRQPRTHYLIGRSLGRLKDFEKSIVALETCLKFWPNFLPAHRCLGPIFALSGNATKSNFHRNRFKELRSAFKENAAPKADNRKYSVSDVPEFESELRREEIIDENRPRNVDNRRPSGKSFTLVSGLPRSGTSLMMQMLEAGGLNAKTDGEREADVDNPKGYFEWEAIKKVAKDHRIMGEEGLDQKVIKVISALLPKMPYMHEYKVIFMTRPLEEVVASQAKMIDRLDTEGAKLTDEELMKTLRKHRHEAMGWLHKNPRVEFLEVDYPSLIKNPAEHCKKIVEFLGAELLPSSDEMSKVIDASLYRNKSKGSTDAIADKPS
jgi:predicted AlkP superfamily phosphohydrolase/phosphomutase/tetratricopeptide (TPR) repeat protein